MKSLIFVILALCLPLHAQTINPSQIRPSATNGQVVTTVGGKTQWSDSALPPGAITAVTGTAPVDCTTSGSSVNCGLNGITQSGSGASQVDTFSGTVAAGTVDIGSTASTASLAPMLVIGQGSPASQYNNINTARIVTGTGVFFDNIIDTNNFSSAGGYATLAEWATISGTASVGHVVGTEFYDNIDVPVVTLMGDWIAPTINASVSAFYGHRVEQWYGTGPVTNYYGYDCDEGNQTGHYVGFCIFNNVPGSSDYVQNLIVGATAKFIGSDSTSTSYAAGGMGQFDTAGHLNVSADLTYSNGQLGINSNLTPGIYVTGSSIFTLQNQNSYIYMNPVHTNVAQFDNAVGLTMAPGFGILSDWQNTGRTWVATGTLHTYPSGAATVLDVNSLSAYSSGNTGTTLILQKGGGNVSIGDTTAPSMFNVGTSNQFQVSSTGVSSAGAGSTDLNGSGVPKAHCLADGTGCPSTTAAISGMTTGQLPIAASATTVTSSIAYATANTASTVVERDGSGNFSAGTITAALNGTATNITATSNSTITTLPSLSLPYSQVSGTPSIPTVGTWGALNYPSWTSGTPFVKMTGLGTFALDTNTYLATASGVATLQGAASDGATLNLGDQAAYRGIISYTGEGNTALSIANSFDNAAAVIDFNLRTAGTPVTALALTSMAAKFVVPTAAGAGSTDYSPASSAQVAHCLADGTGCPSGITNYPVSYSQILGSGTADSTTIYSYPTPNNTAFCVFSPANSTATTLTILPYLTYSYSSPNFVITINHAATVGFGAIYNVSCHFAYTD
jgi:hypothetical protein